MSVYVSVNDGMCVYVCECKSVCVCVGIRVSMRVGM